MPRRSPPRPAGPAAPALLGLLALAACSGVASPSGVPAASASASVTAPATAASCTGSAPCASATVDAGECAAVLIPVAGCPGSLGFGETAGDTEDQSAAGAGVNAAGEVLFAGRSKTVLWGDGRGSAASAGAFFLARRDASGNYGEIARFDAASLDSMALSPTGSMVVAGTFRGSLSLGGTTQNAAGADGFVAAVGPDGRASWSRALGAKGAAAPRRVAVGPAGHIVLTGSLRSAAEVLDTKLSASPGDAFAAVLDGAGRPVWADRLTDVASHGVWPAVDDHGVSWTLAKPARPLTGLDEATQLRLTKRDAAGHVLFEKAFAPGTMVFGAALVADSAGHVYVVASLGAAVDFGAGPVGHASLPSLIVAKLEADGRPAWGRTVLAGAIAADLRVVLDGEGRAWIAGVAAKNPDPAPDPHTAFAVVARLDAGGGVTFVRLLEGWGDKALGGVAVRNGTSLVGLLSFDGTVRAGARSFPSAGESDLFLFEIRP